MSVTIEYYLDFSSPYSYLAEHRLRKLARSQGLDIEYKPFLLGVIFAEQGHSPAPPGSPKRAYAWRDIDRSAAMLGLPYRRPEPFPFNSMIASRMFYALEESPLRERCGDWVRMVFHTSFADGRDCSDPNELIRIADAMGLDGRGLLEASQEQPIKDRLRAATDEARTRGVFGSPTFFLNGEMFWGTDRIDHIEWRLSQQR